ncbi:hypothetical protein ROZALSC1DRAFT_28284 [Rozella allomycis CSF55]|uniref:Uncharacterized protein n=1 Tax=Rozella allomycis (strain CSF55) TaxID=988480 RepID=A0A075APR5_ROZAC|nr:hypothetical protein O9G_005109 [Rozella allomycis CSF55]RKP20212.1 hypothetical protein ROZALSC1DRAFT_28284 [Rozella allomycis CSF55]|eukprot:EPZ32146.1 hypothetical protein O9G_005109 [Rozella allomycis CSF55]
MTRKSYGRVLNIQLNALNKKEGVEKAIKMVANYSVLYPYMNEVNKTFLIAYEFDHELKDYNLKNIQEYITKHNLINEHVLLKIKMTSQKAVFMDLPGIKVETAQYVTVHPKREFDDAFQRNRKKSDFAIKRVKNNMKEKQRNVC